MEQKITDQKTVRIDYIDALRAIALSFVFFVHVMENAVPFGGQSLLGTRLYTVVLDYLGLSEVAVSLFFIISGFCLMMSSQNREFSTKKFYLKRFIRILIPYYFIALVYIGINLIRDGGFGAVINSDVNPVMIIFTLLGMDGFLSVNGITPFTTIRIGEWFLGALVLIYLVFPLLIKQLKRSAFRVFAISTVIIFILKAFSLLNPPGLMIDHSLNIYISVANQPGFTANLYLFIIGCYIYSVKDKINYKVLGALGLASVFIFFLRFPFGLTMMSGVIRHAKIVIFAVTIFVLLMLRIPNNGYKITNTISKYSMEFFMIHHPVVNRMLKNICPMIPGLWGLIISALASIFVTAILSLLLKHICTLTGKMINNLQIV